MSSDTKWIIGTTLSAALTLAGLLTGLMLAQFSSVNGRMDRLDDRLRAVEIGLAEVKTLISGGGRSQLGGGGGPMVTPLPRGN